MSLVEIIVAVVILSVAVAPLLYTFVYTTNFNVKAKTKQRAINAATSVMETFKSYRLEESKRRFIAQDFLKDNAATYTAPTTDPEDGIINGIWTITGMTFSDGTGDTKPYDVTITVAAGNTDNVVDTPLYDPSQDVLFVEDPADSFDPYKVVDKIIGPGRTSNLDVDTSKVSNVDIHREINISIDSASSVTVNYSFECTFAWDSQSRTVFWDYNNDPKLQMVLSPTAPTDELGNPLTDEYGNTISAGALRNLFFYFYPAYKDRFKPEETYVVRIGQDEIHFKNSYQPTNVFLFKQKNNAKSISDLKNSETTYRVKIVNDGVSNKVDVFDAVHVNLATTIGHSISTRPDFFDDSIGGDDSGIELHKGLDNITENLSLYSNVTITVTDPNDKKEPNRVLATIRGTVLR